MNNRISQLAVLSLALTWGLGSAHYVSAQDSHAGHDHAAHAEHDGHDDHEGEEHDEHGEDHAEEDDHSGHEHAEDDGYDDHEGEEHDEHSEDYVDEEDHSGHDHDAHAEEDEGLRLTTEQRKRFGIVVLVAGPGSLRNEISLPGEIEFNQDRVVHIVPRVSGISREVLKSIGDTVEANEILAVIESRELADAKSEYLAARARAALAQKTYTREQMLREKQVSSEQDYLEAEQSLAEARIEFGSAEQKLHALGLSKAYLADLDAQRSEAITRYEIRSPIKGVVTEKHISLGESLEADAEIFTVVDVSSVWVNLTVYTKNLGVVRTHQQVTLRVDHSGAQVLGEVSMVTPFVEESTRSASARVVLDNNDGQWVPGTFVTALINTSEANLPVVVSRNAVQNIEGRDIVFIEHDGNFEMSPVILGRMDRTHVEVVAGLDPGTSYVEEGAFQLKATVITSTLDSHAGHGH